MKLAIVTAYPPSKVTLNEYAYHLVKHLRQNRKVTEIVLLTDAQPEEADLDFPEIGCKVTVEQCWSFNNLGNLKTILQAINKTSPDSILFNLQFMKFGDNKIAAALGLLLPWICRLKNIPTIVLLHNIMETVDLDTAGFYEQSRFTPGLQLHRLDADKILTAGTCCRSYDEQIR